MNLDRLVVLVCSDIAVNKSNLRCLLITILYRCGHYCSRKRKSSSLGRVLCSLPLVIYRFITEWILQYEIPAATVIGRSLIIDHGYGIVINKNAVLGDCVRIKHQVTIGAKTNEDGSQGPSPVIGSRVDIGAGAIVLGGISIGSDAKIGAGAVVVKDVPAGAVVVGNPARIILTKDRSE